MLLIRLTKRVCVSRQVLKSLSSLSLGLGPDLSYRYRKRAQVPRAGQDSRLEAGMGDSALSSPAHAGRFNLIDDGSKDLAADSDMAAVLPGSVGDSPGQNPGEGVPDASHLLSLSPRTQTRQKRSLKPMPSANAVAEPASLTSLMIPSKNHHLDPLPPGNAARGEASISSPGSLSKTPKQRFQSTAMNRLAGINSERPGDPNIHISMTISPVINECFGLDQKPHTREYKSNKMKFNEHLILPKDTLFPEDSVGSSNGVLGIKRSILEKIPETNAWRKFLRGKYFRQDVITLVISPPARITLGKEDRTKAGIPSSAVFYSFSYPVQEPEALPKEQDSGTPRPSPIPDPTASEGLNDIGKEIFRWLTVGGFVYFDDVLSKAKGNQLDGPSTP